MPTRPKQHHYVMKAYLEGFLDRGCEQLFCYGRHRRQPFRRKPEDLATRRNYHSFKRTDGTWDDSLEALIQKDVEDPGLRVIRRLAAGETRLDWTERENVSLFAAVQRFRVPHFRTLIDVQYQETLCHWLREYEKKEQGTGFDPGPMIVGTYSPLRPGQHEATFTKSQLQNALKEHADDPERFSRQTFINLGLSFAKRLKYMKWTVYYTSAQRPFLTSDCPVTMAFDRTDIGTVGLLRPDCRISFPLANTALLYMEHDLPLIARLRKIGPKSATARRMLHRLPEIRIANAAAEDVERFNTIQADYAPRWVFAGGQNDWLIRHLQLPSRNVRVLVEKIGSGEMVSAVEGGAPLLPSKACMIRRISWRRNTR